MTKQLLLFFASYIALLSSVSAQIKEGYLQPKTFSASETVCSLANRIYLNIGTDGHFEKYPKQQTIVKLDLELNVLDSLDVNAHLNILTGHFLYCQKMIETANNELTAIINETDEDSVNTTQQVYYRTHVIQFDTNLVIQNHFTIGDTADVVRLLEVKKHNDSLYFLGYRYSTFSKIFYQQIVKTNNDGSWQQLYEFHDSVFASNNFFTQIEWYQDKVLIGLDANFNGHPNIGVFSKKFNLIHKVNSFDSASPATYKPWSGFFIPQSNNPPFTIGTSTTHISVIPGITFNMATSYLDSNLSLSKIDTFQFSGTDTRYYNNPKAYYDGFDYNTTDSVFLVMAGQWMDAGYYTQTDSNDIYIYNYNGSTHQLNWMKVYNSGYNNNYMASGEVLPGNRYLVVLNEYNWDKMITDNMAVHLMILNYKGDILSETRLKVPNTKLQVFPNPASTFLNIKLPETENTVFSYELVSIGGSKVSSGLLSPENPTINVRQIPAGTYILRCSSSQSQLEQKVVIE